MTTPAVIGTTNWTPIEQDIRVARETRLLVIRVVRRPSLKFDSVISGTAWIDDVSLTRLNELSQCGEK